MISNEQIEEYFINYAKLNTYIDQVTEKLKTAKFTKADFEAIDKFILKYFSDKFESLELLLVRAYFYGEHLSTQPEKIIKELPAPRTTAHQEALNYIKTRGAFNIQQATDSTKQETRQIIYKGLENRTSWRNIAKQLKEAVQEDGAIRRHWDRVAISEVSAAINNGYLADLKEGEFIIGTGYPDACEYCRKYIIGKVYRVGQPTKHDFGDLDPLSQPYKDLVEYWEKYVWVGKSNYGKAPRDRRRVDGGYETRLRHETYFPTIPLHPSCRCRWSRINPKLVYADNQGRFIPRKNNEKAWGAWYEKEIKARYKEAA